MLSTRLLRRAPALLGGALVLAMLLPAPAGATLLRHFDLPSMSREAHVIVRGRVLTQEARWNEERTRIYRYSELEVLESVKGARVPERLTVKQIGGTVGETTLSVVGTAELTVGEEVLLFLRTDGRYHYLVGMHQGRYGVRRDDRGAFVTRAPAKRVAPIPARSKRPVAAVTLTEPPAAPGVAVPRVGLDELLGDVRRHLRTPAPAPTD